MSLAPKIVLLVATLGLSACSQGLFGNNGPGGAAGLGAGGVTDPTSVAYFNQTVGDRVLFSVDVFTLDDAARAVLNGQAEWLANNPEYTAVIEGHADEQGTREYNVRHLARVARTLGRANISMSRGVAPGNRLQTVVSYGKERPIEVCSATKPATQRTVGR